MLLFGNEIQSQNSGYYYMYKFEEFAIAKTTGYLELMRELYTKLKYPSELREKEIEGLAKFYIISHGDGKVEIIPGEHSNLLHESVLSQLNSIDCLQLRNNEKFITQFMVNFDLEPFEKNEQQKNTIYVMQYKIPFIRYDHTEN